MQVGTRTGQYNGMLDYFGWGIDIVFIVHESSASARSKREPCLLLGDEFDILGDESSVYGEDE